MEYSINRIRIPKPVLKNKAIINAIPKNINSVMEVGCGDEELTDWLRANTKYLIYGIDVYQHSNKVLLGDITSLDSFPIRQVDVIICSEVLEHIREWQVALRNIIDIAQKKVIITVPWEYSYYDPDHKNFWDDFNIYDIKEVAKEYKIVINKKITKEEDFLSKQRIYFIEIWKNKKLWKNKKHQN